MRAWAFVLTIAETSSERDLNLDIPAGRQWSLDLLPGRMRPLKNGCGNYVNDVRPYDLFKYFYVAEMAYLPSLKGYFCPQQ